MNDNELKLFITSKDSLKRISQTSPNELFESISPINLGLPLIILKTPLGNPAFIASSPNFKAVSGVNSDGLRITEQPAAIAAETFLVTMANGKFHGVIATTTPIGCFI